MSFLFFRPQHLNRIFIIFVVIAFAYFCLKIFSFFTDRENFAFKENQELEVQVAKNSLSQNIKSYGQYARQLKVRNIFQFPEDKPRVKPKKVSAKKTVKPPVKARPKVLPLFKSLKLVGVVLDENPEAIVENSKKRETLFLKKGDAIEGAIVEEILEGKIIFLYEGSKVELVQ